ncbi:MAG: hypothetical protein GF311_26305 [Candidatus Lokiarchaeota archaeon]|nr:hypothetical protein [Candidatus Lokiarchaeota archaeon]
MKCHLCDINYEVGECIVCGKPICYEKHAEIFWMDLVVATDCGYHLKQDTYRLEYYCCLEGHSNKEVKEALKREFQKIPEYLEYIDPK